MSPDLGVRLKIRHGAYSAPSSKKDFRSGPAGYSQPCVKLLGK